MVRTAAPDVAVLSGCWPSRYVGLAGSSRGWEKLLQLAELETNDGSSWK